MFLKEILNSTDAKDYFDKVKDKPVRERQIKFSDPTGLIGAYYLNRTEEGEYTLTIYTDVAKREVVSFVTRDIADGFFITAKNKIINDNQKILDYIYSHTSSKSQIAAILGNEVEDYDEMDFEIYL